MLNVNGFIVINMSIPFDWFYISYRFHGILGFISLPLEQGWFVCVCVCGYEINCLSQMKRSKSY